MDIDHLFSFHRFLIDDHGMRINELYFHHEKRLDEIRQVLREFGPSTVKQVTKELHWDIKSKSWEEFTKSQKWFAAGEAHAHLEHLRALGEITMEEKNEVLYYKIHLT